MRVLAVGNPAASGFSEDVRAAIDRELPGAEWFVPGDGDLAGAARDVEVVVVAGGDGTLNHVVNALADRLDELRFGLIPLGTGNDFARTVGLPDDPAEAARVVGVGGSRSFDIGRATGGGVSRLFVNACIGGFPVQVDEAVDEETKRRLGPLAFWVGGAKAAAGLRRSKITIDGREVPDCVAAGVGNGRTCGGGIVVWPDADPADGILDACALAAPNAAAAVRLLLKVRAGNHGELDGVEASRGPLIRIDADPPMELNVDGELVGLTTPATFEVYGALTLALL
ncbi:MAG TPA: YegS/Rv2252/BmrU family lipid kinase [Actinomycetota bacterium]|nr:YegS/Rv2252/BmrU family lipid kinase [Actinomycetota bacterium]